MVKCSDPPSVLVFAHMSSPDDSSLFYLFAPVTTGCSPADAGHWRVYSRRSVLLPAGNEVKN